MGIFNVNILFLIFLLISQIDPASSLFLLAVLVFAAFFSATQDIALDAYRIELHQEKDLAIGIATYVFGYEWL